MSFPWHEDGKLAETGPHFTEEHQQALSEVFNRFKNMPEKGEELVRLMQEMQEEFEAIGKEVERVSGWIR